MGVDIGPKIGIDGEKEFRDTLKSMSTQLKTLGTEMKAVTSAFDVDNDSQKKLAAQTDVLTRQLGLQESKISEIQKALDYARANYAENSNEVQRWQQALNNATADLNNTKKQLGELSGGVDNVGEAMDNAGEKTSVFGDMLKANLLGGAIISGIKAVASGIKSLISGAIEGYGEYEQLVGGVETLFQGSADTVIKNAETAYKTAGLSANDYMETVTSFSASLLQSMGNDTEAAAKKADQAITDMSDNANKMGTDMQSIQNAYQGFAKQNYTMLDNLKLGYGGTKEEMQRLLDDANALNAAQGNYTNYTIDSYADIVDAIHTVQTEMGITGTTALEASTTVEGSISAMKAAYENFVTGLGDENADIGALTEELIQSAGTVAKNVLPVVENVLKSIAETVKEQGPDMITKFVAYATEKLPEVLKLGLQLVVSLVKGLAQNLPELLRGVLALVDAIIDSFLDALPDIIEVGKDIVRGVWEGIKSMAAWIGEKISDFFGGIVDGVKGMLGIHSPSRVFAGIGENMALGLGQGFASEMKSIGAGIQSAIPTPTVDAIYNAAAGMVNGFAAASGESGGGSYTINLVLQNGQQIASWLLPDLRAAARNDPEVATA
ncbi:hypothetical protein [Alistipes sp.]|uniref:phage tail protein n=1 Tax=Alistipes sp. TaxID=1872444 RepID=UPI003991BCCB